MALNENGRCTAIAKVAKKEKGSVAFIALRGKFACVRTPNFPPLRGLEDFLNLQIPIEVIRATRR